MKEKLSGIRGYLSFSNTVAVIALFIALGGASYAAIQVPKNSVGTKQLKKNAVTSKKLKDRSLLAKDFRSGQLPRGATGATGWQAHPGSGALPDRSVPPARLERPGLRASRGPLVRPGPLVMKDPPVPPGLTEDLLS